MKIIIVITLLVALVIAALVISINAISYTHNQVSIQSRLHNIAARNGRTFSEDIDPYHSNTEGYIDNFSVMLDDDNVIIGITLNRNIMIQETDILPYVNQALLSGEDYGEIGSYAYCIEDKYYGRIVVFLDISSQKMSDYNLLLITGLIGGLSILFFFGISVLLSGWLVKPVRETFDKQKMFISDAGHELKTPIAVISANADVLESEIGENKWLNYIRDETKRMSELVSELLSLARLDDKSGKKLIMSKMNLSDLVMYTALPFESTVFEMGKQLDVDVQPDIEYIGDESSIKHILTILIDNAIKYSKDQGNISVKLYTKSNKKIIEVFNTGDGIPNDKLKKVFERFYRQDEARNSTSGGYGLGLAIAKSIVEAHNGKIYAESVYGQWVKFIVVL